MLFGVLSFLDLLKILVHFLSNNVHLLVELLLLLSKRILLLRLGLVLSLLRNLLRVHLWLLRRLLAVLSELIHHNHTSLELILDELTHEPAVSHLVLSEELRIFLSIPSLDLLLLLCLLVLILNLFKSISLLLKFSLHLVLIVKHGIIFRLDGSWYLLSILLV